MFTYTVGAKVVHPCYGAGTITRITEKAIGDTYRAYYIISTVSRPMELMVPVERAEEVKLRPVGELDELQAELAGAAVTLQDQLSPDLRQRQNQMRDLLKSGSFGAVAQVARTLFMLNARRPLGTIDRQLLDQGREFLAGELALSANLQIGEAMQAIQDHLASLLGEES
ncbi:MAG: CarD family transcriptional regulator [Anaerolineales bacterium]